MELHKALKEIISQKGVGFIKNAQIINFLLDYQAFKEKPATKLIFRDVIYAGYAESILALQNTQGWQTKLKRYLHDFIDSHGYKEELAAYVFKSIVSALGLNADGNEEPMIKCGFNIDSQQTPRQFESDIDIRRETKKNNKSPLVGELSSEELTAELAKVLTKHPNAVGDVSYSPSKSIYRVYWLAIGNNSNDVIDNEEIIDVNFAISENHYSMLASFTNLCKSTIEIDWPSFKIEKSRVYIDGVDYLSCEDRKIEPGATIIKQLQPIKLKTDDKFKKMFVLNDINREEFIYHVVLYLKVKGKRRRFTYDVHTKMKLIYRKMS